MAGFGAPEIDDYLRNVLWEAKLRGEGFEAALSTVQSAYASNKSAETKQRLDRLTQALIGMFSAMQTAFNKLDYRESELRLQRFLSQFDAIFTLNRRPQNRTGRANEAFEYLQIPFWKHFMPGLSDGLSDGTGPTCRT